MHYGMKSTECITGNFCLAFVFEFYCWEAASLTVVFVSQAFVVVFIYLVF